MVRGLIRIAEIVMVLLLLSLPVPVQPAGAEAAPSIRMNPTSASPGETVTVIGSGFTANGQVQIYLDGSIVATSTATSAGAIITPFVVPNIAPGQYDVAAKDVATQNVAQTAFTVEPSSSSPPPTTCLTCVPDLNYTVSIQNDRPTIHIQLEITNPGSTALTLRFRTEAWYAENYVHNLSANSSGRSLNVTHTGQGMWMISAVGNSTTFEYDIDKSIPMGYFTPDNTTISVYFNDQGGVIMPPYFFIYPDVADASAITIKFNVPAGWQIVTPYPAEGDHFGVQRITACLINDFLNRQGVEMGVMKYYAQEQVGNCTIEFGILNTDHGWDAGLFGSHADLEEALNVSAEILENLTNLFGGNPYKVFVVYTNFRPYSGGPVYPNEKYMGNTVGYWPEHRRDELIGHMFYAFMAFGQNASAPLTSLEDVAKGMGEMYYGPKIAWEMFNDPIYLGKLYYWYMVYERFYQSNTTGSWEYPVYVKGPFWALMLDNETQRLTGGAKSLDDVVRYLYSNYKDTGHEIDHDDIQNAMQAVTGKNVSDLFSLYVNGNEEIPYKYVQDLKPYFLNYPQPFAEALFNMTIPLFINIEVVLHQEGHIPGNVYVHADDNLGSFATYVFSHYAITNLTGENVEDALSAITGANCSGFFTHWQDSFGSLSLNDVKQWLQTYSQSQVGKVQLVVNQAPGGTTSPPYGSYMYHQWQNVTVLALPNQGYQFGYWLLDGNNIGSQNPVTVKMSQWHSLRPVFSTTTSPAASPSSSSSNPGGETDYSPYIGIVLAIAIVIIAMAYLFRRRH